MVKGVSVNKEQEDVIFLIFYDYDKLYFDAVEAAEMDTKHLAVIKARGKGYSFKGSSMLCRNYF